MSHVHYEPVSRTEIRARSQPDSQSIEQIAGGAVVHYTTGTVEVASVRLDPGLPAVGELAKCLSDEERGRANRFIFERDRCRFIVGRAHLRYQLGSRLGVRPEALELVYGPYGKPALSRRFADTDLHFNISHSEDIAVYAFARGREVGIDVEAVRAIHDADAIVERFFSVRENRAYRALDPGDKPLGFFNCWTRKEAFIKAIGDGLQYPLDRFDVSLVPGEPAMILRVDNVQGDKCGWHMHALLPAPGFVAAVVVESMHHGTST
jgi:4'-phosphopantetheinyl transferase